MSSWLAVGAFAGALAIAAGAFGAHALKAQLAPAALALWETAARYLAYAAFGLLVVGLAAERAERPGALAPAAWCLLAGAWIFSGSVAALALGAPRWLGAVTPLGGLLLIAGFLLLGWAALRG